MSKKDVSCTVQFTSKIVSLVLFIYMALEALAANVLFLAWHPSQNFSNHLGLPTFDSLTHYLAFLECVSGKIACGYSFDSYRAM